jgi:hypothetical protein
VMNVSEVRDWIATLYDDSSIAIDDGGLVLVEIARDGTLTGAYIEVGGTPSDE